MLTLHVDLGTWEVLQGKFLVLILVDHLLLMMIMTMADTWNDPQTIVMVIPVITVLIPAQSVPILQLSVIFLKVSLHVRLFFPNLFLIKSKHGFLGGSSPSLC
jgi:hypothetical protein